MPDSFLVRDRRFIILAGTASLAFPSIAQPQAPGCTVVNATQALVDNQIQGIGVWVLTDGPALVANARAKLAWLKQVTPALGAKVNETQRAEIIEILGISLGLALPIVGLMIGISPAGMILAGMALPAGFIIGKALLAPKTLDPVDAAVDTGMAALDAALTSLHKEGGTLLVRNIAGAAGQIANYSVSAYKIMVMLNNRSGNMVAEADFIDKMNEIQLLDEVLAEMGSSNSLADQRMSSLQALKAQLNTVCLSNPKP